MDRYRTFKLVTLLIVVALFNLACGLGGILATPTPKPTNTPTATNTITPEPTATLQPTETPTPTPTEIPPTPTPVPMGTPVTSADYQVDVISMRTLNTVYLSRSLQWVPTDGNMFVELGIKVVNLNSGNRASVFWNKIYIIEQNGKKHSPSWGEFKAVESDVEVNPKSLTFRMLRNSMEFVAFDDVVFIRAIYTTKKYSPSTLLFGFDDSPLIEVVVP